MLSLLRGDAARPLIVGHRGVARSAPGNTWPSLEAGLLSGADLIECDVQILADRQPIIFHDFSLQREDKNTAWIWETSLSEARAVLGDNLILLQDLLAWAKGRIQLLLDLKVGFQFDTQFAQSVVDVILTARAVEEVALISWTHEVLLQAKELEPELSTAALLYSRPVDPVALAQSAKVDALLLRRPQLDTEYIAKLHSHNIAVGAIDIIRHNCENYRDIAEIGVDLMIVDDPAAAVQCLKAD